jgi:2,4-dienoyl-CoA reductase-like NADH-dependent reductase (Old Yellow Enzyme family)
MTARAATQRSVEPLFAPFSVNGMTLRNRIVMAPMGRHFSIDGTPGEAYAAYYARRALGGVGLVTSEATPVPDLAAAHAATFSAFTGERPLAGWRAVATAVHEAGARYMQQLFHVGGLRRPGDLPNPDTAPLSPSGLYQPANGAGQPVEPIAQPASDAALAAIIAAFGAAAASAQQIGCDGVNLHAAHGYLLDQFFWPQSNRRGDAYGLDHRTRFAEAVVRECRDRLGPRVPIFLRISQWKQQDYRARIWERPDDLEAFLRPFVDAGVDVFDCSTRRFWEPEFEGSDRNLAGWVKQLSGLPTITVGSVGLDRELLSAPAADGGASRTAGLNASAGLSGLDRLVEMLERGDFDLVAVGRALISNPDWPRHVRDRRWGALRPFRKEHLATLE